MKRNHIFLYLLIGGFVALILWLFFGRGRKYISEAVSAELVYPPDEYGFPQYDSTQKSPAGIPVSAFYYTGSRDPRKAACPVGYNLWKDIAQGTYTCFPDKDKGDAPFGGAIFIR